MTRRHDDTQTRHAPPVHSTDWIEYALADLARSTGECAITIPDASLCPLLAAVAGALQMPDLPHRTHAVLCEVYYRFARRLEECVLGAVEELGMTDPQTIDSDQARAIIGDAWPVEGEELLCWQTTDSPVSQEAVV